MTVRLRPTAGPRRRRTSDSEERFQFWVTMGFIGLIVAVVIVLLAAIGLSHYDNHFKPIANVGGASITRDDWSQRIQLEHYRLGVQEQRVRAQIAANPNDADRLNAILDDIRSKQDAATVADQAANDLVDLLFKERLAGEQGITVSPDEVTAQMVKDASDPEQRHVWVIAIEPKAALEGAEPTAHDRQTAYENAIKAAASIAAGSPFEAIARQYSTDPSKDQGGDIGFLSADDTTDTTWVDALFRLPLNGTTPMIKGDDGIYRIGRVTEIRPGTEDPSFRQGAFDAIGEGAYRQQVQREALAAKLADKVTADALATPVDQFRLAEIFIEIGGTDPATDVRVHASHILYSPKDDPQNLASLPPEDPAWKDAEAAAQKAVDELKAIADPAQRQTRFAEIAKSESDDKGSGAAGGELGTFTRDAMVEEFAKPLFDTPDLKPSDVIGPVKSQFGYHVILFQERIKSANDRLNDTKTDLAAAGADFATVAKNRSDGDEALAGGELGWRTLSQLPEEVGTKVATMEVGAISDPIQVDQGFYIEKLNEKSKRPPEGQQAAILAANAFETWYGDQKTAATSGDSPLIVTDESIFSAG
jgi:parvulin-like peptidyl-prolyl isomerase